MSGVVRLIRGAILPAAEYPASLRSLRQEFVTVGVEAGRIKKEDSVAVLVLAVGRTALCPCRLERSRRGVLFPRGDCGRRYR